MRARSLNVTLAALALAALTAATAHAQHVPLPVDLMGSQDGTAYKIRVPENWNGTLLVFAHGTQLGTPVAEAAPTAWPEAAPSLEDQLLQLGYAVAGSGFSSDKDGLQSTLALTNFFNGAVGNPRRVIVWGNSLGARIALKLVEKYPGIYQGAIANCSPGAGSPENMDAGLAVSLAYAAAFGWQDEKWGPVGNLRDDLNFSRDVYPFLAWPSTPSVKNRWEFVRLVMQLPPQAFWRPDPQLGMPFWLLQVWKGIAQRAAAEVRNGGPVAENVAIQYSLKPEDQIYLASLGVDADSLLAYMNARTNITADIAARNHAAHWGAFSGSIQRPVLTLHSVFDGLMPVANESYYRGLVEAAGSGEKLVQAYVGTIGHCSFRAHQYTALGAAMACWLEPGRRPDASLLPPALGFDLAYVPPAWPF